jgi:sulfite reductase alpha subunit-like flavoprotein
MSAATPPRWPPDVRQAFSTIYQEKAGASAQDAEQDAEQWLTDLSNAQRYLVDIWPA